MSLPDGSYIQTDYYLFHVLFKNLPKANWNSVTNVNVRAYLFEAGHLHHTSTEIAIVSHPYSSQSVSWNYILGLLKMHMNAKEVFLWGNLQLIFQKVHHLWRGLEEKARGPSGCFSWTFNHQDYIVRVINYFVLFSLWQTNPTLEGNSKKEQILWKRNNTDLVIWLFYCM